MCNNFIYYNLILVIHVSFICLYHLSSSFLRHWIFLQLYKIYHFRLYLRNVPKILVGHLAHYLAKSIRNKGKYSAFFLLDFFPKSFWVTLISMNGIFCLKQISLLETNGSFMMNTSASWNLCPILSVFSASSYLKDVYYI